MIREVLRIITALTANTALNPKASMAVKLTVNMAGILMSQITTMITYRGVMSWYQ